MISDEMRELLSAYVDDELRDSDAARVEEMSKRDPELRREIDAYRRLRKKLKDWDEAEHGGKVPATLQEAALARARALVHDRRAAARGRILSFAVGPVPIAAAVLLAIGGGLFAARSAAPAPSASPVLTAEQDDVGVLAAPPPPIEVKLPGSALLPYEQPELERPEAVWPTFLMSRRAQEVLEILRRDEEQWRRVDEARARKPEGRTGTPPNARVFAMLRPFRPGDEPWQGLVLIDRSETAKDLREVNALPVGARVALDDPDPSAGKSIWFDKVAGAFLSPLGEVWIGKRDGTGRTRIVTATSWGQESHQAEFFPVVWADDVATPTDRSNLELQGFILGPRARREALKARGRDEGFREWIATHYGRSVEDAFREGRVNRDRMVRKLTDGLARNATATGFAVVDAKGDLMGVEIFASHALMLEFAPRLLHGYLLEAGESGITLTRPMGAQGPAKELVGRALERLPSHAGRIEEVNQGPSLPAGMRRVNLLNAAGTIIGHGLLAQDGTPIHLTIFTT